MKFSSLHIKTFVISVVFLTLSVDLSAQTQEELKLENALKILEERERLIAAEENRQEELKLKRENALKILEERERLIAANDDYDGYYVSDHSFYWQDYRNDSKKVKIGTIASKKDICRLFQHPVFDEKPVKSEFYVIPIHNIINDFRSNLPDFDTVYFAKSVEDMERWKKRWSDDFSVSSTCVPLHLLKNGKRAVPYVKWQGAGTNGCSDKYNIGCGSNSKQMYITSQHSQSSDFNPWAVIYLKEAHPALMERFDEIYLLNIEKERKIIEANKARDEATRLAILQKELEIKAEENRQEELKLKRENALKILEAQKELAIKAEENRQLEIKLAKENELKREQFWDSIQGYTLLAIFVSGVGFYFFRRYENRKDEEYKEQQEEQQRRDLEDSLTAERVKKENKEIRERKQRKWEKQSRKIQREINSIKKSIDNASKEETSIIKKISDLDLKKKEIEDKIYQLNDDIKKEKKIIKDLRGKYPFIDDYIENR